MMSMERLHVERLPIRQQVSGLREKTGKREEDGIDSIQV